MDSLPPSPSLSPQRANPSFPKWIDQSSLETKNAQQQLFFSILKVVLAIMVLVIGSLSFSKKGLNDIYLGSRTAGALTFTIGLLATLYTCNGLPSRHKTWDLARHQLTYPDSPDWHE